MDGAQLDEHFSSVTTHQAALRAKYGKPDDTPLPSLTLSAGAEKSPGFFDPLLRYCLFDGFWLNAFSVLVVVYVIWRLLKSTYQRFEDLYQARLTRRDPNDQAQYFYSRTDFFFEALGEIVRFVIWTLPTAIIGNAWPLLLNLLYLIFWPVRIVWSIIRIPWDLTRAVFDAWVGSPSYFRLQRWLQYLTSFAFWKYIILACIAWYAIARAYKVNYPDRSTSQRGAASARPSEGSSSHYERSHPSPTNDLLRYCYRTSESGFDCYPEPRHELDRPIWSSETTETATMTKDQEWVHEHCTVGDPDRLTCYSTRISDPTPGIADDAVRESGDAVPYSSENTFATEEPKPEPTKNRFGESSSEAPADSPDLLKSPSGSSDASASNGSRKTVRENSSQSSTITGSPLSARGASQPSLSDPSAILSPENPRVAIPVSDGTLLVETDRTATIFDSTSSHIPSREEKWSSMGAENSAAAAAKNAQYHNMVDEAKGKIFRSPSNAVASATPGRGNQVAQKLGGYKDAAGSMGSNVREALKSKASSCGEAFGSAQKNAKGVLDSCGEALRSVVPINVKDAINSGASVVSDAASPPLVSGYSAAAKGGSFASRKWDQVQSWLKSPKTAASSSTPGSTDHTKHTSVGGATPAPSGTSKTPRTSAVHDEISASHASTHHSADIEEFTHDAGATTSDNGQGPVEGYSPDDTEDVDLEAEDGDKEESSHTSPESEEAYDEASSRTVEDTAALSQGGEATASDETHTSPDDTDDAGDTEESDDEHQLPPLKADLNDTHEVQFDLKASTEDYEKLVKKIAEDGEDASWKFELEGQGTRTTITASEAAQTQSEW